MKNIKINAKPQENGLYGMPLNCYRINGSIPAYDNRKNMLFSAIINAIDERYDTYFKITFIDNRYFRIDLDENKYNRNTKSFNIYYDKYEYSDSTLYEFDNNNEKLIFLRKLKLKKLKNNAY